MHAASIGVCDVYVFAYASLPTLSQSSYVSVCLYVCLCVCPQLELVNEEKAKKKKSYRNSGVAHLQALKVSQYVCVGGGGGEWGGGVFVCMYVCMHECIMILLDGRAQICY